MVGGCEGKLYSLPNLVREEGSRWRARKGGGRSGLEVGTGEAWVTARAAWGCGNQGVTVAGAGLLKALGLGRSDLQPCIDRLTDCSDHPLPLLGEAVLALRLSGG